MKTLRILFKVAAALVMVLLIAAVALVFLLDPNVFKPRLEAAARDQGVALSIDGNLGWQFWPALGLEVNQVQVAALETPDQPIARLEGASLRVAFKPLLRGDLVVHHVGVQGAELDLKVDEKGEGNWEPLLSEEKAEETERPAEPEELAQDGALRLAVDQINIRDAALSYRNQASGQTFDLSPLNLAVSGLNLEGNPFDLELDWEIRLQDPELFDGQALMVKGTVSNELRLAGDMSRAQVSDGQLSLAVQRQDQVGETGRINLAYSATAYDLAESLSYQGDLRLSPFNPRALMSILDLPAPETRSPEALTNLAFSARFEGDTEQARLDPVTIEVDDTLIEGHLAVTDLSSTALDVALEGDQINLDGYLPPGRKEESEPAPASTGDEELIPLETVQSLNAKASLDFGQIKAMGLTVTDLSLRLTAQDGLVELTRARLNAYEGQLSAQAELDGRGDTASIHLDSDLANFQLAPLMRDLDLDEQVQLSGTLNIEAVGDTQGLTMNQLMEALKAEAQFSGEQVRLAPLNVEEQFCRLMEKVGSAENLPEQWPDYTEMHELAGRATVANQIVEIESFKAGVSELALQVEGQFDLEQESYDLVLPMRLGGQVTSRDGCRVDSNYWVDRSLSLLRCRGSLTELNPVSDCGLDSEGVKELIQAYAEYRLGDKVEEEKARAEERLEEKKQELEDEAKEEVEERLRGLFGR